MTVTTVPASLPAGTIAGDITYDGPVPEAGRPGNKALSLDGDGDYVRTSLRDLSGSEITISYWFKGSYHRSIVRQQSSGYIVAGYSQQHILSNDGGTSGISSDGAGAATVQDGEWHHVAMTWKQDTTDGFASYLDGVLVDSRDSSNFPIPAHNSDVFFGSVNGVGEFTNGMVDEVAIWNRALEPAEIRAAMAAPLTGDENGLVGYWNFDDGAADDLTAAANHGTLFGDASIVDAADLGVDGNFVVEATPKSSPNRVLCLDGINDHVVLNSLTNLSGSEITISYWFKGSFHRSIVRQQFSGYLVAGYSAQHILSNDGGLTGVSSDGNGGATVQDGQWHHVVMTWKQGTVDGFASYLDGMPVASRDSSSTPIPNHARAVYFGSSNGTSEFTNGCIDEVAIWNRALSPAEIASNWNRRLEGNEPGLVGYWSFDDGTADDSSPNGHNGELRNGASIVTQSIENLGGVPLRTTLEAAGSYLVPDAIDNLDYCIDAYFDANGNGKRDDHEWRASFPGNPVTAMGDLTGIDLVLYDPASVWLDIERSGEEFEVSWPEFATGLVLTSSVDLGGEPWEPVPGDVTTATGVNSITVPAGPLADFFRLEDEPR